ncbi:hypothetical protein [Maribacter dokdonensis]|uniref:hypothetical protein n=1 Tax=Maribacter dokdonensis TaxID=320912 RepID=UPI0020916990|nr:hypothetical protein [Maribacter dokdonensis]
MNKVKKHKIVLQFLPTIGIIIFVGLYVYSAKLYPGGSQANLNSVGFDWINNYWCNLMNEKGMNGKQNPAKPFAISAMVILCFSLTIFFIQFARKFARNRFWKIIIQIFGVLTMAFAVLIFTEYHDIMTTLSSIFGVFVVIGIIWEVYKSELNVFKTSGIACIFLLVGNNYIYYSGQLIEYLPLIQKITFLFVLIWIIGLNYKLTGKNVLQHNL